MNLSIHECQISIKWITLVTKKNTVVYIFNKTKKYIILHFTWTSHSRLTIFSFFFKLKFLQLEQTNDFYVLPETLLSLMFLAKEEVTYSWFTKRKPLKQKPLTKVRISINSIASEWTDTKFCSMRNGWHPFNKCCIFVLLTI